MEKEIYAIRIHPKNGPVGPHRPRIEVVHMENTLEAFQRAVGGLIEAFHPIGYGLDWICNEEGKFLSLPPCFVWLSENGRIRDTVVGEVVVVRHDNEGNFASVKPKDLLDITEAFRQQDVVRLV